MASTRPPKKIITTNTKKQKKRGDGLRKSCLAAGTMQDASNRKRVEGELREGEERYKELTASEERYRTLVESSSDAILTLSTERIIVSCNEAFLRLFGYELAEAKGKSIRIIHPSDESFAAFGTTFYPTIEKEASVRTEWEFMHKDGRLLPVETVTSRIRGTDGQITGYVAIIRDISERKRAEEALKRSEEQALRLARETAVIAEIGRVISSSFDIEEVYERFAEEVRRLIPFDRILVNLANLQDGRLTTAYSAGMEIAGRERGRNFPIAGTVTEEMIRTGVPVLYQPESIEDVHDRFPGLAAAFEAGLRSRLSVLLINRGEVIGALALWSKHAKAYGEQDIRLAQGVANQIAGAIANAQLFRERTRAEAALRESEESYRGLVETSPDAIFLHDGELVVYLNPAAVRLFGARSAEDMYGKKAGEIVHPDYREEMRTRTRSILETGKPVPLREIKIIRCDGSSVDVEAAAGISYYRGKKVVQVIQRDVTERKRAEEALRMSEHRYHMLFENMTVGFALHEMIYDDEGKPADYRYVEINPAFEKLTGVPASALLGKTVKEVLPNTEPYWIEVAGTVAQTGEPTSYENYSRELGKYYDTWLFSPAKDRFAVVFSDITLRKRAEDELRASEGRFRSLVETTSDWIWETDQRGVYTYASPKVKDLLGYEPFEVVGKTQADLMPPEEAERIAPILRQHFESASPFLGVENVNLHKDGHRVLLEMSGVPIFDDRGLVSGYRGIDRDITERKRAEEQIKASLQEKEVLLKEIHHRVKNNLQIISSLLYLQANKTEHPGALSALTDSRNRVRSMALVHERLYRSPSLASVNMGEYTRNLVSDLKHTYQIGESSIRLTLTVEDIALDISEAVPCGLIINELLSNALKHAFPEGRGGEITVRLTRSDSGDVVLMVGDSGVGLPEHLDFRNSPSLGLTLVNSLVRQLEGTIELDSRDGTTFTISLKASQ